MEKPRVFKRETHTMWGHKVEYIGIAKSIRIKDALDNFRNLIGQAEELKPKVTVKEPHDWPNIRKKPEKTLKFEVEQPQKKKKRDHISNLEDIFEKMDKKLGTKEDLLVRKSEGEVEPRTYVRFNTHQLGGDDYIFHISIKNANQKEREAFHKAFEEFNAGNFGGEDPEKWYKYIMDTVISKNRGDRPRLSK